jgi:hypothetical protein
VHSQTGYQQGLQYILHRCTQVGMAILWCISTHYSVTAATLIDCLLTQATDITDTGLIFTNKVKSLKSPHKVALVFLQGSYLADALARSHVLWWYAQSFLVKDNVSTNLQSQRGNHPPHLVTSGEPRAVFPFVSSASTPISPENDRA